MRELLDTEKAYIAGIIDGEGCFTIRHQNKQRSYYPVIQVCNTDYKLMSYLFTVTGIGILCKGKWYGNYTNRKDYYKWTVARKVDVYTLLDAIAPYLIVKKEKAFLLYRLREIKSRPLVRKGLTRGKLITSDVTVNDLKLIASKMSELNFRGLLANGVNSVDIQNGQYRAKPESSELLSSGTCDGQA